MQEYKIKPSKYFELKMFLIGKFIGFSCHFIGKFMPYFFAGKLENFNVNIYSRMDEYFKSLGINKHYEILLEMEEKEREHEVFFFEMVKDSKLLPIFSMLFRWGRNL